MLHQVLSSLPDNLAYRLLELRLEKAGRVDLAVEVKSHGGGDELAAALQRGGFQVQQPHSQQLTELVAVQLAAQLTDR